MHRWRVLLGITFVLVSLSLLGASTTFSTALGQGSTPTPTDTPRTPMPASDEKNPTIPPGKIAYVSRRDTTGEPVIYIIDGDGGNRQMLTCKTKQYFSFETPAWSPDGNFLAFVNNFDIYIMDAGGNECRNLTNDPSIKDYGPAWSPDGRYIAFASDRGDYRDIYVIQVDGKNLRRVTNNSADNEHPSWSPDGKRIAFSTTQEGNWEIFTIKADGTDQVRVTDTGDESANNKEPAWSPDGKMIAFVSDRPRNDVFLINADGTGMRVVSDGEGFNKEPAWSPDGNYIAFTSFRGSSFEDIYVVGVDGKNLRRLTKGTQPETHPSWAVK